MSGNRLGVIGGRFVNNRIKVARWAVVGGVILTVGAAAGAASMMRRAPAVGDACLCTPDTQDTATLGVTARGGAATTPSYSKGIGILPASTRSGSAGALAPFVAASGPAFWNARAAAVSHGNGGAGWMSRGGGVGAYSGSSSHRVGALGGLWRFMNFARHASPVATHASAAPKTAAPKKPNRGPSNGGVTRPAPGGGGGADTPAPIATTPVEPPLFGGPGPSIGDPIGGGPISIPGIGIGGTGGGIGPGGPALATTPEPGSIILLGTGVLGLFGMLRRRALQ